MAAERMVASGLARSWPAMSGRCRESARTGRAVAETVEHRPETPTAAAHGTRQHRGLVGQDVAEHVFGRDHVEVPRPAQQVHRHGVDQHVLVDHVRIVGLHLVGDLAPQA